MQMDLWAVSNKYENSSKIVSVDPVEDNAFREVNTVKWWGEKNQTNLMAYLMQLVGNLNSTQDFGFTTLWGLHHCQ